MMQQPARSADNDIASGHSVRLEVDVLPADDETGRELMEPANLPEGLEDLVSQFPSRSDHQSTKSVFGRPLQAVEEFQ